MFPKPQTYRSKKYLAFIRSKPCVVCFSPAVPHHETGIIGGGVGSKTDDSITIPLCAECHQIRHDNGYDTFWQGFDPPRMVIKFMTEYLRENGI